MHHDTIRKPPVEPCFEAPPRLHFGGERRLTAHAVAAFTRDGGMHEFRDNAVGLEPGHAGRVVAVTIGRAVATAFALRPGLLDRASDSLADALADAFDRMRDEARVVAFQAAVATPRMDCVLLRGVLLPTAAGADAVLSWKQVLGADATEQLRADLLRELAAGGTRRQPVDAFA